MRTLKDQIVRLIGDDAERQVARLAGEFARAASEEKEDLLAALEFQRWLAETCWECLDNQ